MIAHNKKNGMVLRNYVCTSLFRPVLTKELVLLQTLTDEMPTKFLTAPTQMDSPYQDKKNDTMFASLAQLVAEIIKI